MSVVDEHSDIPLVLFSDVIGSDDDLDSNSNSEDEPEVDQNEHRKGMIDTIGRSEQ